MIKIPLPGGLSLEYSDTVLDKNDFIPDWSDISKLDECYCSSDFHILKEFIHRNEDGSKSLIPFDESIIDNDRIDKLIDMCDVISDDDAFVFLGDITESEFDEDSIYIEKVKEIFRKILKADTHRAPRILVRGNNDVLSKEKYKEFGFDFVVPKIELGNILFTHKPLNVDADHINIHGHLHENKSYFDISPRNHINVYFETNGGPQTVSTFLNRFNAGFYSDTYVKNSDEYKTSDMIEDTGENYE